MQGRAISSTRSRDREPPAVTPARVPRSRACDTPRDPPGVSRPSRRATAAGVHESSVTPDATHRVACTVGPLRTRGSARAALARPTVVSATASPSDPADDIKHRELLSMDLRLDLAGDDGVIFAQGEAD